MAPTPALIATCVALALLSGCTSNGTPSSSASPGISSSPAASPSPPQSPSATPSATWSADQAAAIQVVDDYRSAIHRIEQDPSAFSEAEMKAILKKVAGGDVVTANAGSYMSLKKRGFRYDGDTTVTSTKATRASAVSYGTEVFVTRCIDQRRLRVLNKNGDQVSEAELGYSIPPFNLRQYTVVRRTGSDGFLVYGLAPAKGECGP